MIISNTMFWISIVLIIPTIIIATRLGVYFGSQRTQKEKDNEAIQFIKDNNLWR